MVGQTFRGLIQLLGVLLAGAAVLLGALAWSLSSGPISLSFLTPYFEAALSARDGSYAVRLEDTILTWAAENRTLEIRIISARAVGSSGEVVAEIPDMSVTLSGGALLRGEISPRSLSIFGPSLTLVRRADGRIEFALGGGQRPGGEVAGRLLQDLLAPPASQRNLADLSRIKIVTGDLTIFDEGLGVTWKAPAADISFQRSHDRILVDSSLEIEVSGQNALVDAKGDYDFANRQLDLKVEFEDVNPSVFARLSPKLRHLRTLDASLGGTVAAKVSRDGIAGPVTFDLRAGKGRIAIPSPFATTFEIMSLAGKGVIDPVKEVASLSNLEINFADAAQVFIPAPLDHELPMKSVRLSGTFGGGKVEIDHFSADLQGPVVEAKAVARMINNEATISMSGSVTDLPGERMARYWPEKMATLARAWILENVTGGGISELTAEATARWSQKNGFEITTLSGDMAAGQLTIDYLPPMPKVVKAGGRATFDLKTFAIDLIGGEADGVKVKSGTVLFTGLDQFDQFADIDIITDGSVLSALRLVDREPLGFVSAVGLSPVNAKGHVTTRLKLKFLVERGVTLDQVEVSANALMADVFIPNVALGQDLNDGQLTFSADKKGMTVSGKLRLGSLAADLNWRENFGGEASVRSRYRITTNIGDAHRALELGLDFAPFTAEFMTGSADSEIIIVESQGGESRLTAAIGLTDTRLAIPPFGWEKLPGVAGRASLAATIRNGKIAAIDRFEIAAGDLKVSGEAAFDAGGAVRLINFDRFTFARSDLSAVMTSSPGGWNVDLAGASLDLEAWLEQAKRETAADNEGNLPPVTITTNLARVYFAPDRFISNVAGRLAFDGDLWTKMKLTAVPGAKKNLSIDLISASGKRTLTVRSNDAGSTLRALDLYDDMVGGALKLEGVFDDSKPGSPLQGVAKVNKYRVIKASVLARLLSIASLTGIVETLGGEGLAFSVLDAPFVYVGGVATVRDARASGISLGVTATGTLDTNKKIADLKGTVVPAYLLNSVLANIPLIGPILRGGEKGGGVFAANYTMRGPLDKPDVSVNPLSVLAPGILRRLFDVFDSDTKTSDLPPEQAPPESTD